LHGRGGGHVRSSLLLFVRIRIRSILVRIRWTIIFLFTTIIIFQILALSKLSLSHFSLSFSSSDGIVVLREFVVGVGVVVLPDRRHDLFRVFSLLHSLLLVRVKIDDKSSVKQRRLSLIRPKGREKQKKQKIREKR
jgi:hypothetical protein